MKESLLEELKNNLMKEKMKILSQSMGKSYKDLAIDPEELSDEMDLAGLVVNQLVDLNIRSRELQKLRAIEGALERIENSSYGLCEECGDPIGASRLRTLPFTTLCIQHAEERERQQQHFVQRFH